MFLHRCASHTVRRISIAASTTLSSRHECFRILPFTVRSVANDVARPNNETSTAAFETSSIAAMAAMLVVAAAAAASGIGPPYQYLPVGFSPDTTRLESSLTLGQSNDSYEATLDDSNTSSNTGTTQVINWSGTHSVQVGNAHYYEPETVEEVQRIVSHCHETNQPVRPLGSALSPNGLALHSGGMMSLAHLDQIVAVDTKNQTVTVQAGARVNQVIEALRPYRLTLPNLASIAEQQMGGFVQVGAHGTGRLIAPVDHYVTQLKLVTPSGGLVTLSEQDDDPELFHMAKVGLGCLGVVVEVTMSCIPAHFLREQTVVLTRQQAREQLNRLLTEHKHMRYMWIPYTDAVVCVTNDPVPESTERSNKRGYFAWNAKQPKEQSVCDDERLRPLTDLLFQVTAESGEAQTHESIQGMGFAEIRDLLLAVNPLDVEHVKRCNEAEAKFWKRSQGSVVRPSDELLQFDCGGQVGTTATGSFWFSCGSLL
jgi:L-galactono-1,4-lactone dehydrogenase